jgi:hypothetical protein
MSPHAKRISGLSMSGLMHRNKTDLYSISSSARTSSDLREAGTCRREQE